MTAIQRALNYERDQTARDAAIGTVNPAVAGSSPNPSIASRDKFKSRGFLRTAVSAVKT